MAATPNSLASLGSHSVGLARVSNFGPQTTKAPGRLAIPKKPASGSFTYTAPGTSFTGGTQPQQTLADYITQARNLANQQVQAQVNAIQAQQTLASQQAAVRAHEINQAAAAAADYLQRTGLAGGLAQQDYQQALGNQTNLAQGFSGQLAHDAAAQQQQAQQSIGAVAGNTQQLKSSGDPLANVLYGLGGYLPGQALNVQGLGAVAAARAVPGATLGYGQQQAANALQTGAGTVQSLGAQIAQAEAQRPSITQNLIGQFSNAYNQANSSALQAKEIQSLIDSRTAATQRAATAQKLAIKTYNFNVAKYNAGITAANAASKQIDWSASSKAGILYDKAGNMVAQNGHQVAAPGWHFENQNGNVVPVKDTPPTDPAALAKTQNQEAQNWTKINHFVSNPDGTPVLVNGQLQPRGGWVLKTDGTVGPPVKGSTKNPDGSSPLTQHEISTMVSGWLAGKSSGSTSHTVKNPDGTTTTTNTPTTVGVVSYPQAIALAKTYGKQAPSIIAKINALYPEGKHDRPWTTPALEQKAAQANAQIAVSHNLPWQKALDQIMGSGYFLHRNVVLLALRQAYHLAGVTIPKVDLSQATASSKTPSSSFPTAKGKSIFPTGNGKSLIPLPNGGKPYISIGT